MTTLVIKSSQPALRPLIALLAVQLLLALWLLWPAQQLEGLSSKILLQPTSELTSLTIEHEDDTLTLSKSAGQWQLSSYFDLPVRESKLTEALSSLDSLRAGWPVATTDEAAKRFEVASDNFQRKLTLQWTDGKSQTLWLGTSPGYRKQHLRVDSESEIYAPELSAWQFAATGKSWLDTSLLSSKDVTKVQSTEFAVSKDGDIWRFEGPKLKELDQDKWQSWLNKLTSLAVQEASTEQELGIKTDNPVASLKVWQGSTYAKGDPSVSYSLYQKEKAYWLKSSAFEPWFKVSQSQADTLIGFKLDEFAAEPKAEEEPEAKVPQLLEEKPLEKLLDPKASN